MKKIVILLSFLFSFHTSLSQNLRPYKVGFETSNSISATEKSLISNLTENDIKVVGKYQPADDKNRFVIIISSTELENSVKKVGGLTGFAATLRIGITVESGKTVVTYTNPEYWGNAYFQNNFALVATNYTKLNINLENAMKASGEFLGKPFGSVKGISTKELKKYHYMIGMPNFEDVVTLGKFNSYKDALNKIDLNLSKGVSGVKLVSKVSIPSQELTLYNLALSGSNGEKKFMPIIDVDNPKYTAFLPYELLVNGNQVVMLHGRYRIALSFPDLTMGTFTKIMSTPGDIEKSLKQLVK